MQNHSREDGIVLEKRSVRLQVFRRKATSKVYALPPNFHRKQRYIQKIWGQQRSEEQSVIVAVIYRHYFVQALILMLAPLR
ncbi:MAG TPA: hypothetical protein VGI33_14315 [Paenibacillus sp.]